MCRRFAFRPGRNLRLGNRLSLLVQLLDLGEDRPATGHFSLVACFGGILHKLLGLTDHARALGFQHVNLAGRVESLPIELVLELLLLHLIVQRCDTLHTR